MRIWRTKLGPDTLKCKLNKRVSAKIITQHEQKRPSTFTIFQRELLHSRRHCLFFKYLFTTFRINNNKTHSKNFAASSRQKKVYAKPSTFSLFDCRRIEVVSKKKMNAANFCKFRYNFIICFGCVCMCVHACVSACVRARARARVCVCVCVRARIHCVRMHAYDVSMYVCLHVHMHATCVHLQFCGVLLLLLLILG